jgi:hypothetical protein
MRVRVTTVLLLATVFLSGQVLAEEKADWQPLPPMPDNWDWIQLVSDEWLKGEIFAMFNDELEFESDELDRMTLDFDDIKQIRSARVIQVGFLGGGSATGKLLVEGDRVRIIGAEEREFHRSQILTLTAGQPKESNYWSGKASLGANVQSGNSDQVDFTTTFYILRRTIKNRIALDFRANYSSVGQVDTTSNQRASTTWDKFISDRFFFTPVALEYFSDTFQNIEARNTVRIGVGYQLVDKKRVEWRVSGGPAYQVTLFDSVADGEDDTEKTASLAIDTFLDVDIAKWLELIFDYQLQIVSEKAGSYTHHMVTTLETEVTSLLDFDVSLVWDRTENPRPDADDVTPAKDDLQLVVSVGLEF